MTNYKDRKVYLDDHERFHRLDGPAIYSSDGRVQIWVYHGDNIIEFYKASAGVLVTHFYDNDREEYLGYNYTMDQGVEYCQSIFNQVIKLRAFL